MLTQYQRPSLHSWIDIHYMHKHTNLPYKTTQRILVWVVQHTSGACVWGCRRGRTKSSREDSGQHWRGLIAAPTSVLERRYQKFPRGLSTSALAFHLRFSFPIPPHLTAFNTAPFLSLFTPLRAQCWGFLTLIPRSSLLTGPSDCVCVHAFAKRQEFPTAIWGRRDTRILSDKLIDE